MRYACVLSFFSHARLFATPWTAAHQAPLSMGFPRQEYWSGLPFPPAGDLADLWSSLVGRGWQLSPQQRNTLISDGKSPDRCWECDHARGVSLQCVAREEGKCIKRHNLHHIIPQEVPEACAARRLEKAQGLLEGKVSFEVKPLTGSS